MNKLPEYRRTKSRPGFPDMPYWQKGYTFLGSVANSHPNRICEVDLFGNHVRTHSLEFLVLVEAKTEDDASEIVMQNLPFTVANARYSKGLLAVKPVSDGSIWKTPAAELAEFFCTRYTHREGAYLLTPRAFDMLVWAYRNGYEASNISNRISKIHGPTVWLTRAEFAQSYNDNK